MSDHDHEQMRALETEKAYIQETSRNEDRIRDIDEQIDAVRARIEASEGTVAAAPATTADQPPPETATPPKPRRRSGSKS